ncbi:MAG: anti-sigma factor [Thermoanaerobaculia bacterium]
MRTFDHPIRPAPTPAESAAIGELARQFRDELGGALAVADEVPYELLERAVDGKLNEDERDAFEQHLEDDPQLAAEYADLVALRGRLAPARRPSGRRVAGWAVAALLVAAVGAHWMLERRATSTDLQANATPQAPQVLFQDGFESGDASSWSN